MIKIQAIIAATLLPEDYDPDGFLFFDIDTSTDVSFFKNIEEINDLNQITEEAVLGFTLPRTNKNIRICESFDLESVEDEPLPINVIASVNGQTLRQNRMLVLNVTDESETYEVEIERPSDHWISGIEFRVCELEFAEYTFTGATVSTLNNAFPYQDGDTGICFPIANYGTFLGRSNTPNIPGKPYFLENYRPFISPLKVLQDGFCKLGWTFESPLLQTDYGRSLATYILSDDLTRATTVSNEVFASASKDNVFNPNVGQENLLSDNIIWDNIPIGANTFISNQFFATPGIFDVQVNFNVGAFGGTGTVEFIIELFKSSGGSSSIVESKSITIPVVQAGPQNQISFVAEDVDLLNNELLFVRVSYRWNKPPTQAIVPTIFYNGNFLTRRKAGIPLQGDTVKFSDLINCEYLFIDYLKGISHIFNFKFITDWANRKVIALTTDKADVFGQTVNGYYLDTIKDVEPLMKSRSILNKRNSNARYALLEYAPSTDPGVQRLTQPNDDPIFSKRLDYGSDLPDRTTRITNPFFEVTRNDSTAEVTFSGIPINMPYIWDNTDGKLSFKIAPRILYFIPQTQQYTGLVTGPTAVAFRGVGANVSSYPWAFMVQPLSHFFIPPTLRIEENVIYGDVKNDMSRFWVRDLFAKIVLKEATYQLLSTFTDYQLASFRNLYRIFYHGREYLGRLINIESQSTLTDLANYTFQPEPSVPLCDLLQEPDETIICQNSLRIEIDVADDECEKCVIISIDGSYESPLDNEIIEVSFDNGETWIEENEICCDQHNGQPFLVRVRADFTDDCPSIVRTTTVNPCEALANDYQVVCVNEDNCFTIEIENLDDECEDVVIFYNIDGGDEELWDGQPVCIEQGSIIFWRIQIQTTCCGVIELLAECIADDETLCDSEFGVTCIFEGSNLTLERTGDVGDVALDIVQYRCEGTNDWCTYECDTIIEVGECECWEVKRVLIYCNDNCPTRCFFKTCCTTIEPCEEVDGGTPINLIICNEWDAPPV